MEALDTRKMETDDSSSCALGAGEHGGGSHQLQSPGSNQMKEYYERGSGVNSSAAEASQRGPPAASLGPINTNFPRRFLCCLLPLPIQCMHKPKRELVNIFVGDTAHLRVSGKSVCHFLTGGSGTGEPKKLDGPPFGVHFGRKNLKKI